MEVKKMKNYYLITKEATKYWKKAIKNDRVMITCHENTIYIVNGYNAFKMPANGYIWDELARPAFMVDMPEEGAAFQFFHGEKQPAVSSDIVSLLDRNLTEKTPAKRSAFVYESKDVTLRLYKNENGGVTGVNVKYDAMIDPDQAKNIYCGGRYSPVILEDDFFTAFIMPVRIHDAFQSNARDTFAKLLEV
jgi:hypothetical protein